MNDIFNRLCFEQNINVFVFIGNWWACRRGSIVVRTVVVTLLGTYRSQYVFWNCVRIAADRFSPNLMYKMAFKVFTDKRLRSFILTMFIWLKTSSISAVKCGSGNNEIAKWDKSSNGLLPAAPLYTITSFENRKVEDVHFHLMCTIFLYKKTNRDVWSCVRGTRLSVKFFIHGNR